MAGPGFVAFSPTPIEGADVASMSSSPSSRYIFRGDDYYSSGPIGLRIGSTAAAAAVIQTPWEHLSKRAGEGSRFVSFAATLLRASKFTQRRNILRVAWTDIQLLVTLGAIHVYTPDDVAALMRASPRPRISRLANGAWQNMTRNGEILIEGQIPEEYIHRAT